MWAGCSTMRTRASAAATGGAVSGSGEAVSADTNSAYDRWGGHVKQVGLKGGCVIRVHTDGAAVDALPLVARLDEPDLNCTAASSRVVRAFPLHREHSLWVTAIRCIRDFALTATFRI